MTKCKITVGNKTIEVEIKRPTFQGFKEKYLEILSTNNALEKLKVAVHEQLLIYKPQQSKSEIREILDNLDKTIKLEKQYYVYPRYVKIGGDILAEYARFIISKATSNKYGKYPDFSNSCALCVSYAFNYGGMPINKLCNLPSNALKGEDGHLYYTGVPKIKELLSNVWKQLKPYSQKNNKDFYKVFYDKSKYDDIIGNPELSQQVKNANKEFLETLKSLDKNGIVVMDIDGWYNAGGHTTFWDKENNNTFLDGTNYLDNTNLVRELCFWEI